VTIRRALLEFFVKKAFFLLKKNKRAGSNFSTFFAISKSTGVLNSIFVFLLKKAFFFGKKKNKEPNFANFSAKDSDKGRAACGSDRRALRARRSI
jgi:hypothetical protein